MNNERLEKWKARYNAALNSYEDDIAAMDSREGIYNGTSRVEAVVPGDRTTDTVHVRNLCAELVDAQVNSAIPQPKVTAVRKKDEPLAKTIEDMLRNELDRLPMEMINDLASRIVPVHGGGFFLLNWDNEKMTHTTVGEIAVSFLHPKKVIPQPGITDDIEKMDYFFVRQAQTKEYIRRRYGVSVADEGEETPEIRGGMGESEGAEDVVTQVSAYYRNDNGGIGLFSWVNDIPLCDYDDYQARRLRRCKKCGQSESADVAPLPEQTEDGTIPDAEPTAPKKGVCSFCGCSDWEDGTEGFESVPLHKLGAAGQAAAPDGGLGGSVSVPYYKPDVYPVVLIRNTSKFGSVLGESDIDKIKDQQNTTNRLSQKIIDKLCKGGSYMTLPESASISVNTDEIKTIRLKSPADKAVIDVMTVEANVNNDLGFREQVYEEARQIIGITDSYQGRRDTTAQSGKAKEFAARQSAGRLESKRVMRDAAFAALFEAMFKFKLAYSDEPRPVVSDNAKGEREYSEFDRYAFLEQDAAGEWYWNDGFLFSVDPTSPLANDREAMWQETRLNFQQGAFGDPAQLDTLILFWSKMEALHYPGASDTKVYLMDKLAKQQAAAEAAAQREAAEAAAMGQMGLNGGMQPPPAGASLSGGGNINIPTEGGLE